MHQANPLVCDSVDLLSSYKQASYGAGKEGQADDEEGETGEGAVGEVDEEHDEGDEDGDGAGPHHVEHGGGLVDAVGVDAHEVCDAAVSPAGAVTDLRGALRSLALLFSLGGVLLVPTLFNAPGLRPTRQDHRLFKDEPDEDGAYLPAHHHPTVDEVVGAQALTHLHGRDAQYEADAPADGRAGNVLPVRDVGVGGELDEEAEGEGRDDHEDVREERRAAAEPDLEGKGLSDGPEERVLGALCGVLLEGGAEALRHGLGGAVRVDAPEVVSLEGPLIPDLERCKYI